MDVAASISDSARPLGQIGSDRSSFCEICQAVLETWDTFSMELDHSHVDTLFQANDLLELRDKQGCHLYSVFAGYDKYVEEFREIRSREHDLLDQGQKPLGTTTYQMLQNSDAIELHLRHTLNDGRDTRRITQSLPVMPWSDTKLRKDPTPLADSTSSKQSLLLAKQWLQECRETHEPGCRKFGAHFLPTRLIDIGTSESIQPRLCLGKDLPIGTAYFSLSHCWGKAKIVTLVEANLKSMLDGIRYDTLSKTFQDALIVTRELGMRYIWIDSLCIIQDSVHDWRRESAQMCEVYYQGSCNISAAAAPDGTFGLFFERDPLAVQLLSLNIGKGESIKRVGIFDRSLWYKGIEQAPLSSRGWVCQERLLSPRSLYFGAKQIFWECRQSQASETFPHGVSGAYFSFHHFKKQGSFFLRDKELYEDFCEDWAKLVSGYTAASLTRNTDKLVALAGMAKASQPSMGGRYLAGLWEAHLPGSLLWYVGHSESPDPIQRTYIAPSWSWASEDAIILYHDRSAPAKDTMELLNVVGADVELVGDDPFGQVSWGRLQIRGTIARARVFAGGKPRQHPVVGSIITSEDSHANEVSTFDETISWDYKSFEGVASDDMVYILPVWKTSREETAMQFLSPPAEIAGLILGKSGSNDPREFRRYGMFRTFQPDILRDVENGCEAFRHFAKGDDTSPPFDKEEIDSFLITII